MKKIICAVFLLLLLSLTVFSVTSAASSDVTDNEPVVTTTISDTWVTLWNNVPKSDYSITVKNRGLDTTNSNYGNFSVYNEIEVVKPEEYYANPQPVGYGLSETFVDLTPYEESGTIRFWADVPKDMSIRLTMKHYDGTKYSESSVTVAVSQENEVDGYQPIEIPLKSFFEANKNWNATQIRYFYVGGIKNCDADSFLNTGEILRVSHFEIWNDTPPEPVEYDATPVYRDINGKTFIKDINGILAKDSIVKAFNNTLEAGKYESVLDNYSDNSEILSLYTVSVVSSGFDKTTVGSDSEYLSYKTVPITDYVELHLPVTEEMNENYIAVATVVDGEAVDCEYTKTDQYLVIRTNSIDSIIIINTNAPAFIMDTLSSNHEEKLVNDNTNFNSALLFKKELGTGYEMLYSEYDIPITDITDWLKNENGALQFWAKVPYREGKPDIDFNIVLCARYYINGSAQYPKNIAVVSLPADGQWHEIRMSSSDFSSDTFDKILGNEEYLASYNAFYVYTSVKSSENSLQKAEGLYFSDFSFYKKELLFSKSDGNIVKPYKEVATLLSNPSWKYDKNGYVTRTQNKNDEMPFFKNSISFKACDTYTSADISEFSTKQMGVAYKDGVECHDFSEWAYYNRSAMLRFWVKSDKDITFKVGILASGSTNSEITATVSCKALDGWQEIRLKRSDFSYSSTFDNIFVQNDTYNVYLNFYVLDETFVANQSLEFSQRVEFFSDMAYDKGDITLDGSVNVMDLVRTKKSIANSEAETLNGDIDSDGSLTATDLTYIRKWLLSGNWK
ncbi:MAG: dockerin type I repeat-containing protein [Clostridia bacterium]|nr:dockerin type I repeat-containing protein [Clostridia bacterium]